MRTLSISSGKGGVGKTAVSMNLGIALAQRGHRAAVVDCDFGLANLALGMGLEPTRRLKDVVLDGLPIMEAFTEGPGGVQVLAGASGDPSLVDLDYAALERLSSGFEELERHFDFVLFDNAAGLASGVLSVSAAADRTLLVCTPDPTSMMDAYATAKLIFKMDPEADVSCVINSVSGEAEAREVYEKLATIARDYLGKPLGFTGFVRHDRAITKATRTRRPVVAFDPRSAAARDLSALAGAVSSGQRGGGATRAGYLARLLRFRPGPTEAPAVRSSA